jgi:hypothetical protein
VSGFESLEKISIIRTGDRNRRSRRHDNDECFQQINQNAVGKFGAIMEQVKKKKTEGPCMPKTGVGC